MVNLLVCIEQQNIRWLKYKQNFTRLLKKINLALRRAEVYPVQDQTLKNGTVPLNSLQKKERKGLHCLFEPVL